MVRCLEAEIATLEQEIMEHRLPADDLNEDLRRYLGHNELELHVEATGYTINRSGVPATTLSEGEGTAIALLYFLKSLEDRRFDMANGVVVLDDPVSSLDANGLYLAFGFIRERTQQAQQLFVFTHNFALFRQVRNWFHHLRGQRRKDITQRPARFYMLNCTYEGERRASSIRQLDPLLERYESEYHYLFARVYRSIGGVDATLEDNYILPNIARRVLETFMAFRQPDNSGDLWNRLQQVAFDEAKKTGILRFVHTHSHRDTIGEAEHDPSILGESSAVLTDLLDLIKSEDPNHFDAMVRLVNSLAEEEFDDE